MAQEQSKAARVSGHSERLYDLDNFRTYLTALVIYHHASIPYGGLGSWIYGSRFHTQGSSPPLMVFTAFDQTYFMGSFFFLSGYFSSRALKRKGSRKFLWTKFTKLGLPTLGFTLFGPLAQRALMLHHKRKPMTWEMVTGYWTGLRGVRGPVWYLGLVVIFDVIYTLAPHITMYSARIPLAPAFLVDITASFLLRLIYPVGATIQAINLQPVYLPQYGVAYLLGASLNTPPTPPTTKTSRDILLAASLLSAGMALSLLYFYPKTYTIKSLSGPNLLALSYVIWNECTSYLVGTSILSLFRSYRLLNIRWGRVGKYSYAGFLVHPVVCVGAQVWTDDWKADGVLKTIVIGTLSLLGSWGVGWTLANTPLLSRILV